MEEVRKLIKSLKESYNEIISAQVVWATVKSVDWDAKTMVCEGLIDELDFLDVLLGLDGQYIKPKFGTKVLIALINNNGASCILLFAQEVDELRTTAKKVFFNNGDNGGLLINSKVNEQLNNLQQDLNSLKQVFTTWVPVPSDGGAALKTAISSYASQALEVSETDSLSNNDIKH